MNWRYRIAVVLLIAFAAAPAAGALCAMTCLADSDAMAAHHEAGRQCDDPASASSASSASSAPGPQVGARSHHDCQSHDGAVIEIVTTAAQRDSIAITAPIATNEAVHLSKDVPSTRSLAYTPQPATAPPTATPLVLRI